MLLELHRLSCLLWHEYEYWLLAWFDERPLPIQLEHYLLEERGKLNVFVNCSLGIDSSMVSWWWTRNRYNFPSLAIRVLCYWVWYDHTPCLAERHIYMTLASSNTSLRIDCFPLPNTCISNNICRAMIQLVEGAPHEIAYDEYRTCAILCHW